MKYMIEIKPDGKRWAWAASHQDHPGPLNCLERRGGHPYSGLGVRHNGYNWYRFNTGYAWSYKSAERKAERAIEDHKRDRQRKNVEALAVIQFEYPVSWESYRLALRALERARAEAQQRSLRRALDRAIDDLQGKYLELAMGPPRRW